MKSPQMFRPNVRSVSYFLCSVLLPMAAPMSAQTPPAIDRDAARAAFDEAAEMEAGQPWPAALYGPILLVSPDSREVVANVADTVGLLEADGGLFVGTLPGDVGIANTSLTWAGRRWSMLIWPLPAGYFARRVLLAHEMFHRLGPAIGLPMASPANAHLEEAEARTWLRLELRALARAVAVEGATRRQAVEDALAFRQRRREMFPDAAPEERALELNEGLAEYTGIHAALPPAGRAGWTVRHVENHEIRAAGQGISRNFAYATGPAYGLLLDEARPGWTARIDESFDLADELAAAMQLESAAIAADRARERMFVYGGHEVERQEAERAAERVREQEGYRRRYVDGPVLTLPVDEHFSYSFDPNAVSTMDGVGQVLSTAEVRAGWGTLEVSGGVLLRREERGIVAVVVPAPDDPTARPVGGDGWTLTLAEGWRLVETGVSGSWTVRPVDE